MFFFRTSFCCCGVPLREGTIALLVTDLLFYLYVLYECLITKNGEEGTSTLIIAVLLVITVLGFYGIYKKLAAFLIPHMVTQVLTLIIIGFFIFGLLFARSLVSDAMKYAPNQNVNLDSMFFFFIFPFIIIFGTQYHFYLVVLSYCLKLKEERDSAPIAMTVLPAAIVINNNSQYP